MTQFTPEEIELMRENGIGQDFDGKTKEERKEFFSQWINVQLDRGEDIKETNATFDFVSKKWNEELKKSIKTSHGKEIVGTLIAVRSQLKSKHDVEPRFSSSEFNPFNKKETIVLFDADGKKIFEGIYEDLKTEYTTVSINKDGTVKKSVSDYNYFINLYIDCGEKKYKIQMKGYDRSSWMNSNQKIKRAELLSHKLRAYVGSAKLGINNAVVQCIQFELTDQIIDIKETMDKMKDIKEYFFKAQKDEVVPPDPVDPPEDAMPTQMKELPVIQVDEDGIDVSEWEEPEYEGIGDAMAETQL